MKKLVLLVPCFCLVGFTDFEIERVKNASIRGLPNYTYGKILDNHNVCEEVEWKSYEETGIKKVSYHCVLKKGNEFFNFNEEQAQEVRQEAIDDFTATHYKELDDRLTDTKNKIADGTAELEQLKPLLKVEDYLTHISSLKKDDPNYNTLSQFITYGYICGYLGESQESRKAREKHVKDFDMSSDKENTDVDGRRLQIIIDFHDSFIAKGMSENEARINKIGNECIQSLIRNKIKYLEDDIKANQIILEVTQEEIDYKNSIDKEAKEAGEMAVVQYSLTHKLSGEENVIWGWNTLDKRYDVLYQYRREHEYGYKHTDVKLEWSNLIYAAQRGISDVDVYMKGIQENISPD